jgi:hypothetical protein
MEEACTKQGLNDLLLHNYIWNNIKLSISHYRTLVLTKKKHARQLDIKVLR